MQKIKKLILPVVNVIRGGFLYIISGSVLTKAITMISSILIVRLVTKEIYAHFVYAANLWSYVELLNGLELSGALLILCSKNDDKSLDKAYFRFCTKWAMIIQLVASILFVVLASFISLTYPEAKKYVYMFALIPTFATAINCIQSYNRAHIQNKRYSAMGVVRALVMVGLTVILVPFSGMNGHFIARYAACVSAIILGGSFCIKNMRGQEQAILSSKQKKEVFRLALSMMVASCFSYLMPVNETFLVNTLLKDSTITANFKVAGIFPQQLSLISGAVCIYFYPLVAKTKNYRQTGRRILKIGVYNFLIVTTVAFVGILATPLIIWMLYGTQYMDAVGISRVLWIMRATNSAYRVVPVTLLPALGDTKFNFIASPVICLVHFVIDYIMIKKLGLIGVSYAAIVVNLLTGTVAWIYLWMYCKKKAFREEGQG